MTSSRAGLVVATVAVRRPSPRIAASPKKSPGPSLASPERLACDRDAFADALGVEPPGDQGQLVVAEVRAQGGGRSSSGSIAIAA
jgi:hypothetical protein